MITQKKPLTSYSNENADQYKEKAEADLDQYKEKTEADADQ